MRYLIYLVILTSTSLSAGSIQKWTDEDGNVSYGDAPPLSAKTEDVRVQSAPSNPGKALPRLSTPEPGEEAADGVTDEDIPKDQAQIACAQAQEDLQVIKRSSRIKLKQADGSSRYLTSEEIDERRIQAEGDVTRFCQ